MNNIDKCYQQLLQDIIDNGVYKSDRTGTGTISVFGRQIRHNMKDGFPLLTTKKMAWKSIVTELLWFLRGDTNIKYLVDNGCHIWDGDAYKAYLNRIEGSREDMIFDKETFINEIKNNDSDHFWVKQFAELGPIYGKQWRGWKVYTHAINYSPYLPINEHGKVECYVKVVDQIANLIYELKTNPDSRRLMVNAWNVGELDQMVLPPCHYGFQVYTRELSLKERLDLFDEFFDVTHDSENINESEIHKALSQSNIPTRAISLMWNQRSVDTFLGLPFNIASYGLLLEIIAKEVNMVPDELIGNLGDCHLYLNHIEQAKEQIGRERTHEEMVEIYNKLEEKKDREGNWTWQTRFEDNNIQKHTREPFELPKLGMDYREGEYNKNLKDFTPDDFCLINYQSHPSIKAPLSN